MNKPKVLILDIETRPAKVYVWRLWQTDAVHVIENTDVLSVSYKWAGEKKVHHLSRNTLSKKELGDKLKKLFDEAHFIMGHNAQSFDVRRINRILLDSKLPRPVPSKLLDTLKILKKYFHFDSYKLDNVCKELGIGRKIKHPGFQMWLDCMEGTGEVRNKAFDLLKKYNNHDVTLAEEVYNRISGWVYNQPSLSAHTEKGDLKCSNPVCFGNNLVKNKTRKNAKGETRFQYQCKDCGKYKSIKSK